MKKLSKSFGFIFQKINLILSFQFFFQKWHQRKQSILEMSNKKDRDASKIVAQKPADQYYRLFLMRLKISLTKPKSDN